MTDEQEKLELKVAKLQHKYNAIELKQKSRKSRLIRLRNELAALIVNELAIAQNEPTASTG